MSVGAGRLYASARLTKNNRGVDGRACDRRPAGVAVGLPDMPDEFLVTCPFCGEQVEIYVEPDVNGSFVQDCEVCCNPWRVHVSGRDDERVVGVSRADGSE
jgi:hypothetical protein